MADRPETQEQSIKARKSQLFDAEETVQVGPRLVRRPFSVLLRETHAAPLSVGVKAILWALTIVVLALLLLTLTSVRGAKSKTGTPRKKVAIFMVDPAGSRGFTA